MLGTSPVEYGFIRACILFLHNVAPLSVLTSIWLLLSPLLPQSICCFHIPFPIKAWLVAEAVFFTVIFIPLTYCLQNSEIYHESMSQEQRERLFRYCCCTMGDPEEYLSHWLMVTERDHIKRGNVKDFVRWAFFHPREEQDEHTPEVEAYTRHIEILLGRELPPGKMNVKGLGPKLNEVGALYRSLLWYTCVSVVDTLMFFSMLYHGFHLHRTSLLRFFTLFPFRPLTLFSAHKSPVKHLTYWHRQHTSKTRLPVLFIHGIGVGLYPYTKFLGELTEELANGGDEEVGIIALEIMPVSSRITHPALEKDAMVQEIYQIVKHHNWTRFVLVTHSYGSIIAAYLLKSALTTLSIGPVVLIDPISFLLHLPDVTYNFTTRQPARANEYQLWYFASKDLGVAHTLARRFPWNENIIWKEDLGLKESNNNNNNNNSKGGRDVTVVLSGKDLIVNAGAVRRYLMGSLFEKGSLAAGKKTTASIDSQTTWKQAPWRGSGLDVLWYEQLDHGQVFDRENTRRPILKAISVYSNKS